MIRHLCIWVFVMASINACRTTGDSKLSGHFDNKSKANVAALKKYKGKLRVPAEYEPVEGVLLGGMFLDGLDGAVAEAGVTRWILSGDSGDEELRLGGQTTAAGEIDFGFSAMTPWTRDYGPFVAFDEAGKRVVIDYNYAAADRERAEDDRTPQVFAQQAKLPIVDLPFYLDGGNFMTNSKGQCMLSDALYKRNKEMEDDALSDEWTKKGEIQQTKEAIDGYLKDYFGCSSVTVFPSMPDEPTEHIDLWAKYIKDDTILVHELRDELISLLPAAAQDLPKRTQKFLNDRAVDLQNQGFKVVRLPMLLPIDGAYRNYINATLINSKVIVPIYREANAPDKDYFDRYENETKAIFATFGYSAITLNSEASKDIGGSIHCMTMQIPAPRSK